LKKTILLLFTINILCSTSCKNGNNQPAVDTNQVNQENRFKISLAQWSYHTQLNDGGMSNFEFIEKASELGFQGVEFVNQFFSNKIDDHSYLDSLKSKSHELGLENVLLMVDGAGNLGSSDKDSRDSAIIKHKRWIDASVSLGCPSMRINAYGDSNRDSCLNYASESISTIADYANEKGIRILIENHGSHSNDADWLKSLLIRLADKNVKCNLDFDNWCIEREGGNLWGTKCVNRYNAYEGMETLIPFAHGISVKAFQFDDNGEETKIDYKRMSEIIKKSDFDGYLGIEYEGDFENSDKGVLLTKALVNKYFFN
jgi:sugar phosphate isomerase/epimerase